MDAASDTGLIVAGILLAAIALWLMRNLLRVLYVAALLALGLWLAGLFR